MSGFGGGGFGTPAPVPGGFGFSGAPPAAPSSAPFGNTSGGGFGSPNGFSAPFGGGNTGFGASTPAPSFAAPASFGGGFGNPQQQSSTPATFGAPSAAGGFGAPSPGAGGFGSGGFGASQSGTVGFGQPAQQQQPTGFGQSSNTMSAGFGQSSTSHGGGFGSSSNTSTGFGGGSTTSFGAPFGGSQQQQQQSSIPNPFGGPPAGAPAPAVTFGRSSNVVTGTTGTGTSFAAPASSGFGSSPFASGFGGGGFATASSPATPSSGFGSSGFASTAPSSGFAAGPFASAAPAPSSSMAFGSSLQHNDNRDEAMGGSHSPTLHTSSGFGASSFPAVPARDNSGSGSLSPVPEDTMGDAGGGTGLAEDDQLAKLKAKIEAKKKKLMDRQKQKDLESQQQQQQEQEQKQKQDKSRGSHRRRNSQSVSPVPTSSSDATTAASDQDNLSRAERNAIRFASTNDNTATSAFLPSDLKGKTAAGVLETTTTSGVAAGNREDLATAKSLEGKCMAMCPDEELLRRERENDIQLLEIPDPGGIHPPNWTLRNTAVKRFRRSAADYKLDVPEWVRPPDVLEEVCSYLEEWVMERDRQGPDRRFPNNGTPNSLDVYQFIWDRTRMIRKDFILQNYVGTGGKCDARAVRCHERIARWHAMCEHQLSHISDFVVHQSQQNIQELGQAMKTLNQYYDDSLGRAIVDVPDEEGRETRTDTTKYSHGCKSDTVKGGNPVDYDGTPLNNAADASSMASNRLIGATLAYNPAKGTAEPEMRGLYILLTMNNDGGMEVMRYSARLYRERPEIYNSRPVQLALDIFKAKKDYNYVRFFEILRDPKTPYLFACIMFKHVELMRKVAFRIMSKTYGAKRKENGEPIYDAYPLQKLAKILCFEDMDEARDACKHYNITVKEMKVRSSSSPSQGLAEIIFWRHSDFKEAKDPDKGTTIPCRPRKMLHFIESKLQGATRLGVCRGEVSGEGASISSPVLRQAPAISSRSSQAAVSQPASPQPHAEDEELTNTLTRREEELYRQEQAKTSEEIAEQEAKEREQRERERKDEEKQRLREMEAKKKEQQRQEEQLRRQKEQERVQREQRKREEEKMRREQEERERRERAEKAAREERQRKEEERQRKLEAEARRKAEAEELERQRQEAMRQEEERREAELRAEEERRRRKEAERLKKEQEIQRREALRRQEEERKRQEAEALRRAQELQQIVDKATKVILMRRWRATLPRKIQAQRATTESLKRFDINFSTSLFKVNPVERGLAEAMSPPKYQPEGTMNTRRILNGALAKSPSLLDVPSLMLDVLCDDVELLQHVKSGGVARSGIDASRKVTFLFKVAVILPEPEGLEEQSMYELIHTWFKEKLGYGSIFTRQRQSSCEKYEYEVRVLFMKADSWGGPVNCDAALVTIPPSFCNGDWEDLRKRGAITSAFASLHDDTPRVAYVLGEQSSPEYYQQANEFLASSLANAYEFPVVFPTAVNDKAIDGSLRLSVKSLINAYIQQSPPIIEQVSVMKLASACVCDTLWKSTGINSLDVSRSALLALANELDEVGQSIEDTWSGWPGEDFASEEGLIPDYFGKDNHLPSVWTSSVFRESAKAKIMDLCGILQNSAPLAIAKLINGIPINIQYECEEMFHARQYRKCIQHALHWNVSHDEIFYFPKGAADSIAKSVITNALDLSCGELRDHHEFDRVDYDHDDEVDNDDLEENATPAPHSSQKAEANSISGDNTAFHKPQDIFDDSRTITPVPPPALETPATGTSSPPSGVLSNKRNWAGMASAYGGDGDDPIFSPKRLRKATTSPARSRDVVESSDYTRKLQALLNGESTVDINVGSTTLARLLRDAPPIDQNVLLSTYNNS